MDHEPLHLEPDEFDAVVADVMDELPNDWSPLLDNMAVVVEDEPLDEDLATMSGHGCEILGRYRGSGGPVRLLGGGLTGPAAVAPPELALFQGPLERASADRDDLRQAVHDTLVREIGRYLGIHDDDIDDDDGDLDDDADDSEDDDRRAAEGA